MSWRGREEREGEGEREGREGEGEREGRGREREGRDYNSVIFTRMCLRSSIGSMYMYTTCYTSCHAPSQRVLWGGATMVGVRHHDPPLPTEEV